MWGAIKNGYRGGWAFMLACPLLFMVPVLFEFIQHVGEMHIGMYDGIAQAKAVEHHPLRMGLGMLKILALTVPIYWVTRFLAFGHDAEAARRYDAKAVRLFAVYVLFQLAMAAVSLYAGSISGTVMAIEMVLSFIIGALVLIWGTATTLANDRLGPLASAKIMGFHALWVAPLSFIAILPLMVPHYGLAIAALTAKVGPTGVWAIHIMDSLLVGLLTAIMIAVGYYIARYFADRAGVSLLPDQGLAGPATP